MCLCQPQISRPQPNFYSNCSSRHLSLTETLHDSLLTVVNIFGMPVVTVWPRHKSFRELTITCQAICRRNCLVNWLSSFIAWFSGSGKQESEGRIEATTSTPEAGFRRLIKDFKYREQCRDISTCANLMGKEEKSER